MSKATVVSICNFQIGPEYKPGLHPSEYVIPAAENNKPSVLVVNDGFHDIQQLDYKSIRVTIQASEIARAICEDYKLSQLQQEDGAQPGLFWIDGEHKVKEIEKEFVDELEKAKSEHLRWCERLVKMADDIWQVSKQRRHIADPMIHAARFLGIEREWVNIKPTLTTRCPACMSIVDEEAVVCRHCQAVLDKDRYTSLEFAR